MMERAARIELASLAWKAKAQPLDQARILRKVEWVHRSPSIPRTPPTTDNNVASPQPVHNAMIDS